MTRWAVELRGLGVSSSCREYTHLREGAASYSKGVLGNDSKTCPALDVVVTKQHSRYGVENKILRDLGSLSAGVLNGTLRSLLSVTPNHCAWTKTRWAQEDLLHVSRSHPHQLHLHPKLAHPFRWSKENGTSRRRRRMGKTAQPFSTVSFSLQKSASGSRKNGSIALREAVTRQHSNTVRILQARFSVCELKSILNCRATWKYQGSTDYFWHVGASLDCWSIADAGLFAGGTSGSRGRQTWFFTAVDPLYEPCVDSRYATDQPRTVPYRTKWRRHQDAVYWFDFYLVAFRLGFFRRSKESTQCVHRRVRPVLARCARSAGWLIALHRHNRSWLWPFYNRSFGALLSKNHRMSQLFCSFPMQMQRGSSHYATCMLLPSDSS